MASNPGQASGQLQRTHAEELGDLHPFHLKFLRMKESKEVGTGVVVLEPIRRTCPPSRPLP